MSIYVVGAKSKKFLPLDGFHKKFLVDEPHDGDNIDCLNPWFCELTGLYYMWKHDDDDILGLEHYRRYLTVDGWNPRKKEEAENYLKKYDLLCVKVRYPYTGIKDYLVKNRKSEDTNSYIALLGAMYGRGYADHCVRYLNGHEHILGNMFVAKRETANKYCDFLFKTLRAWFCIQNMQKRHIEPRIVGYMAEFLYGAYVDFFKLKTKTLHLRMI